MTGTPRTRQRSLPARLRDRRGVALPLALLALLILTTLVIGFAAMASTEPMIASNHLRLAQARAAAEAGVEHAAWALSHAALPGGLADPLPSPVPAPYDGSELVTVALRGAATASYRVTVAAGGGPAERAVSATGFMPDEAAAGRARQRITAVLVTLRFPDPPAALTAGGPIEIAGASSVDARGDGSCGPKAGTWSAGAAITRTPATVWGADGNATPNQATDIVEGGLAPDFERYALSDAELGAMRSYARSHGTYFQGSVTFDGAHPLPNGLVFVDTRSGGPVSPSSPADDLAVVDIAGGAAADPGGTFRGWLVVNGSVRVTGDLRMLGFAYVQGALVHAGTGQVTGAVMSRNAQSAGPSRLDATGSLLVQYDCEAARTGGGMIPQTWTIKPGSYREIPG